MPGSAVVSEAKPCGILAAHRGRVMAGPWITTDQLLEAIADEITKPVDELAGYWTTRAQRAVQLGYSDLKNVLLLRGYTQEQLDAWDDREAYSIDQSLYRVMRRADAVAGNRNNYDDLDHRKELAEATAISISGDAVAPPGNTEVGGLSYGTLDAMDTTSEDFDPMGLFE